MSSWLQGKYISLLSYRLDKFKKKSEELYNFRCPLCGDSEENRNKARGYFYTINGDFRFHCHNCTESVWFEAFLKDFDKSLYKQYLLEKLGNSNRPEVETKKKKVIKKSHSLSELIPLNLLKNTHPAKKYIIDRKIPGKYYDDLFYCDAFKKWTNTQIPDKFESLDMDEERIIIPFRDKHGNLIGYQGRLLYNSPVKYMTIMLDETYPKIFNLNRVDFNYQYFVVEGPIDSMFLNNAIATAGGKISSELTKISCNRSNAIVVYDNEPRNRDVLHNLESAIKQNFKVVIWPSNIKQKDINDLILDGYTSESINSLLKENVYHGLQAELRFKNYKKV